MNVFLKSKIVALTGGALVLLGCAITPENAYPEAANARECQVLYEADVRNTRTAQSIQTTSSGNFLADALISGFGKGLAESATQNRYEACLQRVGGAPAGSVSPSSVPAPSTQSQASGSFQPSYGGLCRPGVGVLVGGNGYCVGNQ